MRRLTVALFAALALACAWLAVRPWQEAPATSIPRAEPRTGQDASALRASASDSKDRIGIDADAPLFARAPGTLVVRVRWQESGLPAAGIGMTASPASGLDPDIAAREVATDTQGTARLASLTPGPWRVVLDRGVSGAADVPSGGEAELALALSEGHDVTLLVVHEDSTPAAAAEVWLWPPSPLGLIAHGGPGYRAGSTDHEGRLTLRGLCLARHEGPCVGARMPGFAPSPLVWIDPRDPGPGRTLRLTLGGPDAVLAGMVLGPESEPASGAHITLRAPADDRRARRMGDRYESLHPERRTRTDAAGSFVLAGLAPWTYDLEARAPGLAPHRQTLTLQQGIRLELTVQLHPGGAVLGSVRARHGAPLAGAQVRLGTVTLAADPSGAFRFDGLAPATHRWEARADDHAPASGEVAVSAGEASRLDVVLAPLPALSGELVGERGEPLPGWTVTAAAPLPQGMHDERHATAGAQGAFVLRLLEARSYELLVREPGQRMPLRFPELGPLTAGGPPLRVVVRDKQRATAFAAGYAVRADGTPLPARLAVHAGRFVHWLEACPDPRTGAFRLGPYPPGRYWLELRPDRTDTWARFRADGVLLYPGQTTQLGRLTPPPCGAVEVRCTLAPGMSAEDILVEHVRFLDGGEYEDGVTPIDAGTLAARLLLVPGTYRVTVYG